MTTNSSTNVNAMLPVGNRNRPVWANPKGDRDKDDWRGFAQGLDGVGGAG